jgi:uncharacterized NAD(P)/FAD-binding protein YdhS
VSRRGLLPQAHRSPAIAPTFAHLPPDIESIEPTAKGYLWSVRRHVRRCLEEGIDWREVIASLRPITPRLWERLSVVERARFIRHIGPYWETHRHRMAPELATAFRALIEQGALVAHAGRIDRFEVDDDHVDVTLRPRGAATQRTLRVTWVVNCTGPNANLRALRDPLVDALRRDGLVHPDPLSLGLEVSDDLALLDARGAPSRVLHYVGPFLKARYWEATAVPELREHARRVAATVARSFERGP